MPARHSRHIALTGPLVTWVEDQVANGEYASASDVVRAAIRLLKAQGEREGSASLLLLPVETIKSQPVA